MLDFVECVALLPTPANEEHSIYILCSCYYLCHEFGKAQKLTRQYSVDFKALHQRERVEMVGASTDRIEIHNG